VGQTIHTVELPRREQTNVRPLDSGIALWLNLVEGGFALLTEHQLRRGVHRSTIELKAAIDDFIEHRNRDPKPFIWHKTADRILDSVARFCKRIDDSGHSIQMSIPDQSRSAFAPHNPYKDVTATTMSLMLLRTFGAKEDAIYHHFTDTQFIFAGFALILIIIFAFAALLDYRWSKPASVSDLHTGHKPHSFLHS
jgi:hypothetical protein